MTRNTLKESLETLNHITLEGIYYFIHLKRNRERVKNDLIELLVKELPARAEQFFRAFDSERLHLFEMVAEQGGCLMKNALPSGITDDKVHSLTQFGLMFTVYIKGKKAVYVPIEILNVFNNINKNELKGNADFNTQFIKKISGMIYYYGYLTLDEIFEFLLNIKAAESIENLKFLEIIYFASMYYGDIQPEGIGFRHKNLYNCNIMLNVQLELNISEYKIFPVKEYVLAGKTNYMKWTKEMFVLRKFIIEEGANKRLTDKYIFAAWYDFNNGKDFETVYAVLAERFPNKGERFKSELFDKIMKMFLTMPNWLLKGYSFQEIMRLETLVC